MFALIRQEFIRHLRGRRLYVWLICFSAGACIAIGVMWPGAGASTQQIGTASQSMVEMLATLLAAAAVLVVPAYGAAAITLERERETYDQLRLSLVSAGAVVLGKFLSIMSLFFTIVVALLPVLASTYFLLGLDVDAIGRLTAMAAATASSGAAIGMLCSAAFRRMPIAQTLTFLIVFIVLGGSGSLFTVTATPLSSYFSRSVIYGFAPALVMQSIVSGLVQYEEVTVYVTLHAVLGLSALIMGCWLVAREAKIDRRTEQRALPRLRKPRPNSTGRAISLWPNCIAEREARWGELMTWRWQVRLFVLGCIIQALGLAGMTATLASGVPPRAEMWIALQMGLALFLIPGMTASSIVEERARLSFDFLLMSGMRPSSIFLGKVMGVLASMGGVLLPCVISVALAPLAYPALGARDMAIFASGLLSLVVWMFVCACASTYACAALERPTAAFAASYILCILISCGFGSGLFAIKYYGAGTAFLSPVLGFIEKAADAGKDPWEQFSAAWVWHLVTHSLLGLFFVLLALREVEPFALSRKMRWR